jgi:hypothetical protein
VLLLHSTPLLAKHGFMADHDSTSMIILDAYTNNPSTFSINNQSSYSLQGQQQPATHKISVFLKEKICSAGHRTIHPKDTVQV